jgi:protein O-mannosyl-transferase
VNRSRILLFGVVFAAGAAVYLPTAAYDYVQDDRAIIVLNPAAHSPAAALAAFGRPYWPAPAEAGLYRPLTILSFAVDWALFRGSAGWMHVENALWHGVVCLLVVLVMLRWLPPAGAGAAGLLFALHPVHAEGVANLVSRSELLAALGMLVALLAARRRFWVAAMLCAIVAMLSKERGVVTAALIALDDWLGPPDAKPNPPAFYGALAALTAGYLLVWLRIGHSAAADVAAPFIGGGRLAHLAMALPALWRAVELLFWPVTLSVDYGPQVIPYRTGLSLAAVAGVGVVAGIVWLTIVARHRARALSFAAGTTAIAALPTANLLFPSGIVLSERDLYIPVILPAVVFGAAIVWSLGRWDRGRVMIVAGTVLALLGARTLVRLPAWTDNRMFLLTLLREHPESYRGQQSAGAVLSGMGDTAGARMRYAVAESLFAGDPHFNADYAFFLVGRGDTARAALLLRRARAVLPRERVAMRVEFLLAHERGEPARARAVADTAVKWFPEETPWYRLELGRHAAP